MANDEEITAVIEGIVREKFADAGIESVRVDRALDHEGDDVFKITVVFNKRGMLNSHKTSAIARHVRHRLLEARDASFPIFTFMSKSDAASLKPEAA